MKIIITTRKLNISFPLGNEPTSPVYSSFKLQNYVKPRIYKLINYSQIAVVQVAPVRMAVRCKNTDPKSSNENDDIFRLQGRCCFLMRYS